MTILSSFEHAFNILNFIYGTLILVFGLFVVDYYRRHGRNYPPGPPSLPFIGNVHQIPKRKPWIQMKKWTEQYGPVFTLWRGSKPTIVIGTAEAAFDLLERRSTIYSSRPRMPVMGDLYIRNNAALTMPYGDKWRKHRKLLHFGLMQKAALSYRPIQEWESRRMTAGLLKNPENFVKEFERYATSVVMIIAYGRRVDTTNDPTVNKILQCMHYMGTLNVPGSYLANDFPILTKVPDFLAPWKVKVKAQGRVREGILMDQALVVKKKMEQGVASPCFTQQVWELKDEYELPDSEFANITGAVFAAGSDTTSSSLITFLLAATAFPEPMRKAREELDRVVGSDRSPTWDDEPNLPYLRAVTKESLRWRPVAVLGGQPHAVTQDDVYNGYFIPKGAAMLANLWSIQLNEQNFPDPHNFIPERHLDGKLNYPSEDGHSAFGFGRRKCVGYNVAGNSLFLNICRILWAFDISKAKDEQGKEIDVDIFGFGGGFNIRPVPFKCSITPRSEKHKDILLREAADAETYLQQYSPN